MDYGSIIVRRIEKFFKKLVINTFGVLFQPSLH